MDNHKEALEILVKTEIDLRRQLLSVEFAIRNLKIEIVHEDGKSFETLLGLVQHRYNNPGIVEMDGNYFTPKGNKVQIPAHYKCRRCGFVESVTMPGEESDSRVCYICESVVLRDDEYISSS